MRERHIKVRVKKLCNFNKLSAEKRDRDND